MSGGLRDADPVPPDLGEGEMVRIWSELPGARAKEQTADVATVTWLVLWTCVAWLIYQSVAGFAEGGRLIRSGGDAMIDSGRDLGGALAGIPLVGETLRGAAENAFAGAGTPLRSFGADLEQFIVLVAGVLGLLVVLVTAVPWLSRYVPWRWERLRRTRAGHRAIRLAPKLTAERMQAALALRAVTRLDYATLLEHTPDPLGDWTSGRHDRLATAELASVGLRP